MGFKPGSPATFLFIIVFACFFASCLCLCELFHHIATHSARASPCITHLADWLISLLVVAADHASDKDLAGTLCGPGVGPRVRPRLGWGSRSVLEVALRCTGFSRVPPPSLRSALTERLSEHPCLSPSVSVCLGQCWELKQLVDGAATHWEAGH